MKKVFIAEDNLAIARLYNQAFNLSGYSTETASDGIEAIEKLSVAKPKPDLILLDIMMPKATGFEVLEKIKSDPALKNVPVIVLTNMESLPGGQADLERARAMGAIDVIVKSQNDPQDVVEKVKNIIGKK